jgi:hypothetical protein
MTPISLLFLLLLLAGGQDPKKDGKEPETAPAKPAVAVSFERLNIRENDTVKVKLIIGNDADYDLTNTSLEVHSPSRLKWKAVSCDGQAFNPARELSAQAQPLIPVKARATAKCDLEVTTEATIKVGEFNTLFVVGYQRLVGKNIDASIVTTEKPLKANLLGSESVAGVPLVLAGFIVPGLIFWIVVNFFGVSWTRDGLGDQMIYSVLVSLVLASFETWIGMVDLNEGISTGMLFRLGLGGLVAGLIAGGIDRAVREFRQDRILTNQINDDDDALTILGKLLSLPAHATDAQPMIQLKNGEKYVGSLGARTEMIRKGSSEKTALYSLVGSWEINLPAAGTPLRKEIDSLKEAKKIRELIESADNNKLIAPIESLQSVDAQKNFTSSGIGGQVWRADDVTMITPNVQGWSSPPLEFKN